MEELFKVRNIKISLLDKTSHEPFLDIPCEFGIIKERGGILFLEAHIFKYEDSAHFNYDSLLCHACATMFSFDDVKIEIPYMVFTESTSKEHTVIFSCLKYITIYEEDVFYSYNKTENHTLDPSQLLRIDLWGLDLLITPHLSTSLIVSDAPFEMEICSDEETKGTYIQFPCNDKVTHNTLTEDLFEVFRYSLMGYLSLINGARVQITKEYYNGFYKIYSYEKIENVSRSYYTCGNAKFISLSPILYEFDNYVRWNEVLKLNKFVYHICSAHQVAICEDSSFILILAFEGLCKKYLNVQSEGKAPKSVIPKESFKDIRKELLEVIENHTEIPSTASEKYKNKIRYLNSTDLATKKFVILLDDLNIEYTEKIEILTRRVRSTLVHDAELKEPSDFLLLSELISEAILRLICSKVERHSYFNEKVILGEAPNLPFHEFIKEKGLIISENPLFDEYDKRIKLRIKKGSQN